MEPPDNPSDNTPDHTASYRQMFGFVPPFVTARLAEQGTLDPAFTDAFEAMRLQAFENSALDDKTKQLIAFAVLMSHIRPAAANHAVGARRAGASWEELSAAAEIATVLGALGIANRIGDIFTEARKREE